MAGHAGSAYATANLTWNQTNVGQQYWGEPDIHPQWCQQCAFVDKDSLTKAQGRCIRAGHDHVAQRTDPAPRNRGARGRAPDPPPPFLAGCYTSEMSRLKGGWKAMQEECEIAESEEEFGRFEMPTWQQWEVEFKNWWEMRKPCQEALSEILSNYNPDPYGEAEAEKNNWYKGLRKWAA